jgi:hypothetical protein
VYASCGPSSTVHDIERDVNLVQLLPEAIGPDALLKYRPRPATGVDAAETIRRTNAFRTGVTIEEPIRTDRYVKGS